MIRICSGCGISKELSEFQKDKGKPLGRRYSCKACDSLRAKKNYPKNRDQKIRSAKNYNNKNKEKVRQRRKKFREDNKEKVSKIKSESYQKNKEKVKQSVARWRKGNPTKVRAINTRRRKREETGSITFKDIERLLKAQKSRCVSCRCRINKLYHIDHIIPLAKGGMNIYKNIQLLCPKCNLQKSSKDPIQFMQSKGFLL